MQISYSCFHLLYRIETIIFVIRKVRGGSSLDSLIQLLGPRILGILFTIWPYDGMVINTAICWIFLSERTGFGLRLGQGLFFERGNDIFAEGWEDM